MDYTDINAETIDRWIDEGWEWGVPVTHEEYEDALVRKLIERIMVYDDYVTVEF